MTDQIVPRDNIASSQKKVSELNKQKEFWFNRKEDLKKELNELVKKIKEFKLERDKANVSIESLRSQRNAYSSKIKDLIKQIKKLNKKKNKFLKRYDVKIDPSRIREKINELEKRVEIEVDFKKEQKLMKQINELKKSYAESPELNEILEKSKKISAEITETKKKADEIHQKIIEYTKDKGYNTFIELSKKISEIRKLQEDAFQKFINFKNEYINANNELRKILEHIKNNKEKNIIKKQEKEERILDIIKKKVEFVEQKLKQKKKLTTEDIIAYQGK